MFEQGTGMGIPWLKTNSIFLQNYNPLNSATIKNLEKRAEGYVGDKNSKIDGS